MAYPFRPMKKVRSKELTRKREDSNLIVTVFNRPAEFDTHNAGFNQNQTRSTQESNRCKLTTDNRFQS
jgi:hypothetical protein